MLSKFMFQVMFSDQSQPLLPCLLSWNVDKNLQPEVNLCCTYQQGNYSIAQPSISLTVLAPFFHNCPICREILQGTISQPINHRKMWFSYSRLQTCVFNSFICNCNIEHHAKQPWQLLQEETSSFTHLWPNTAVNCSFPYFHVKVF